MILKWKSLLQLVAVPSADMERKRNRCFLMHSAQFAERFHTQLTCGDPTRLVWVLTRPTMKGRSAQARCSILA